MLPIYTTLRQRDVNSNHKNTTAQFNITDKYFGNLKDLQDSSSSNYIVKLQKHNAYQKIYNNQINHTI